MEKILEKARELGQLIARNEAFMNMRSLEDEVSQDNEISELFAEYSDMRDRFTALQAEDEDANEEKLRELTGQLRKMETELNKRDKMAALALARMQFNQLMDRVNHALQSQILGEDWEDEDEGFEGCSPTGCAGCSGCGPQR